MRLNTKTMLSLAMLGTLAYISMFFIRIPFVAAAPYLKYDPKDVVIVIGGFLFGPLPALAVTVVVAFLEMITVSESGLIGMVMNILSSASFVCTAAFVYKRRHNLSGAVIGLALGCLSATAVMLLWNYFLIPIYTGFPRAAVAAMLVPVFLPFNLLKGSLNAVIAMMLYKPVSAALTAAHLHPKESGQVKRLPNIGVLLISLFLTASIVLLILVFQGRL